MAEKSNLPVAVEANTEQIQNLIYIIRGKQVMIDSDLAMLYRVETRILNQAVKRNISRFPERFRFQLTKEEFENLRSQNVISSSEDNYGGRRFMPYAFTEQGIAMLSSVLKSDVAVQVSINIMDTFVEIRRYMADTMYLFKQVNTIETRQIESDIKREAFEKKTEEQLAQVFKYISDHEEDSQKIFFNGQIFDAFSLIADIVKQADKNIVLIDGYVDIVTLNILAKKKDGVDVTFYTLPSTRLTSQDIANFNVICCGKRKRRIYMSIAVGDAFDLRNGYKLRVRENCIETIGYGTGSASDDEKVRHLEYGLNVLIHFADQQCQSFAIWPEYTPMLLSLLQELGIDTSREFTLNETKCIVQNGQIRESGENRWAIQSSVYNKILRQYEERLSQPLSSRKGSSSKFERGIYYGKYE